MMKLSNKVLTRFPKRQLEQSPEENLNLMRTHGKLSQDRSSETLKSIQDTALVVLRAKHERALA